MHNDEYYNNPAAVTAVVSALVEDYLDLPPTKETTTLKYAHTQADKERWAARMRAMTIAVYTLQGNEGPWAHLQPGTIDELPIGWATDAGRKDGRYRQAIATLFTIMLSEEEFGLDDEDGGTLERAEALRNGELNWQDGMQNFLQVLVPDSMLDAAVGTVF